eukprot:TCALIF_13425-PA protein Name:"Protein of unknown function" AED:0.65 eAED:0.84 QI:0/0/0/0.66/0.2/0.16/6/0/481
METIRVLVLSLLILPISSHAVEVFHSHYKKILGCGVYLLRDNKCYLGSVTNTLGSVFSIGQTENEAVHINPKRVGDLSVKFNYLGGVKSFLEWFSTTDSYIDLPPGSAVNDCLYHCLYEELNCDVAVFENGRCHFGEWNTTAQSSVANLKNTAGPWTVYFNAKYAGYYSEKYAWMRVLNTTLWKVSNHTFMKLTTNLEILCLMGCNFHARHSQPCTFYVFINATNECYLGDIGTSGSVQIDNKNNSVLVTSLKGNLKLDGYAHQDTEVGNHFPLTIPVKGYHINGFFTNMYIKHESTFSDPFKDYTRTTNVSARSYTQVVMPYKTAHHRLIHHWGGFPTLEDCATACHAGFKRSSRDALDMKCQFFFYNATSLNCYVGNLEFKSEGAPSGNDGIITLFIQTAQLGVILGGLDQSHKQLDTIDVINDFRTSCENPAIPTLPVPLYGHAALYSESYNEIVVCGGHQNTSTLCESSLIHSQMQF